MLISPFKREQRIKRGYQSVKEIILRAIPKFLVTAVAVLVFGLGSQLTASATAVAGEGSPDQVMSDRVVLYGNVHPLARPELDVGVTDPSLPMERMILTLRLPPGKEAQLEKLLAEQQNPASPNFRRWLTPEEFGEQFGLPQDNIDAITRWLTAQGFVVEGCAKGRTRIIFSGTAAGVERTFRTAIHEYYVNKRLHHANVQDPSVPLEMKDLVAGIVSLNDFPRKSMINRIQPVDQTEALPDYTSADGTTHYMSPADFSTIYNVNALYTEGINGSGQSIAIVGRTHPSTSNWATFRSLMGLPSNPPQVIVNGPDPGDLGADEDGEADLDVEWSGAVAPNSVIKFVVSKSTYSTDGVDLSAQYIVDNNLAPVMSTSFGSCESDMTLAENNFYNNLWQQAAAQGITSFVASGDAGAAGCNSGSDTIGSGHGINGLASTPYNVAVGGTEFNEGSGTYWNINNGSGYASAISYIPEVVWNESGTVFGGSNLWATGGGVSSLYSKPAWQVSPGVPADGKRDIPDVSLSAADHDAYLIQSQGALYLVSGTSASTVSFAGLMALIVQETGQRQGNANIRFYQIGNAQYGAGGAVVFHDTLSGNNSVPGVTGYVGTAGYDLCTGLGSVNAKALVNNWGCDFILSTAYSTFAPSGGDKSVNLAVANAECAWTAVSNVPWVTITSGNSGTGNGTVQYSVGPNSGAVRTGTITIAGQAFTVIQGTTSTLARIGVFWNGAWYFDMNNNGQWDGPIIDRVYTNFGVGLTGAIPVVGDWDGTGVTRIGVYWNGAWYFDMNNNGQWDGPIIDRVYTNFGVGLTGAIPVVGDWDGTGVTRIGVYWNGVWYLDMNNNGQWDGPIIDRVYTNFGVGLTGAIPVVGDWDGTGVTRIGVYWNGAWYLDMNNNGQWDGPIIDRVYTNFGVGLTGAIPVVGDWDGTGVTRIGVYWNGAWYLDMNNNGQWDGPIIDRVYTNFGVGLTGAWPVAIK